MKNTRKFKDDFLYGMGNSLKIITLILFFPLMLLVMALFLIIQPFTPAYWNGGTRLPWGWEALGQMLFGD